MGVIATSFSMLPSCSTVARIRICSTNYHRWWSNRRRLNLLCAPKSINSCVDRLSGSDSCDYSVEFVTSLNQCSRPYDLAWVKMHPRTEKVAPIGRLGRTRSDDCTYRGNTFWPVARSQLWVDPFLDFWWFFIKIWRRVKHAKNAQKSHFLGPKFTTGMIQSWGTPFVWNLQSSISTGNGQKFNFFIRKWRSPATPDQFFRVFVVVGTKTLIRSSSIHLETPARCRPNRLRNPTTLLHLITEL